LQRKAKSLPKVTRQVRSLIDDMMETMYAAPGVGLAAPQVGIRQQVVVVDVVEGPITLVNPEIIAEDGEQLGIEACLWRGCGEAGWLCSSCAPCP
jgi:peptide deformylase